MKNLLLIGFLLVVLFTIPITLFLVSQQTQTASHASPATRMNFIPSTKTVAVGDNFQLDINLDPGNDGSVGNAVAFVDLVITYPVNVDLQKTPDNGNTGIKIGQVNGGNIVTLTDPKVTCATQTCQLKVSLGMPPGNPIKGAQPIATVYFTAKTPTDSNGEGAAITLDGSKALSSAVGDKPSDNVLIGTQQSTITISGQTTPTPTDSSGGGGNNPTPTDSGSGGSGGSGGNGGSGGSTAPLCTSLSADKTSAASAPASINFTATGNSSTSTISKVTFNFGDGTVTDVTTGGGVGTNAVNAQLAHQYSVVGAYTASATLTDASGNTSTPSSCSQTITIGQSGATTLPTDNPTPTPASIPSTGPGETIVTVGLVGAAIMVVGGLFLFGM